MERLSEKALTLVEALPYIRKFYGKTFVVKYGGAAQIDEGLKSSFAEDIVLLNFIGIHTIIVHGGGPRISKTMEKMGKKPLFIQGQRVTDEETMDIVEMVIAGIINKEIVHLINSHGGRAVGLSGKDASLIKARKKVLKKKSEGMDEEVIDLGLVGDVEEVDPSILYTLIRDNFIPVIAPVGFDLGGRTLNINADLVASAVAGAVKAEKLVLMTDVEGILDKRGLLINTIKAGEIQKLVKDEVVTGGMIPKVHACLSAIKAGVSKAYIIDGRIRHSLLLEIFTEKGIGTEIVP